MPKYKLDERGILTIVNEHDSAIFTVSNAAKKITSAVIIMSIVCSILLYVVFYYNTEGSNTAFSFVQEQLFGIKAVSNLGAQYDDKVELSYGFGAVWRNFEEQSGFYADFFRQAIDKGRVLYFTIAEKVQDIIEKGR